MRTTPKGLTVWDLPTDQFDHTKLSANLDLIDSLLNLPAQSIETLTALPVSNLFTGRLVMLSSASGGFQPWTLIRYDGSSWRPVNQIEIQPAVPTSGNFAGRVVILSNADSGFPAWGIIRYDGAQWQIIGGWQSVNTGGGGLNIQGLQTTGDVYVSTSARGLVLRDRSTNTAYRMYFNNGSLQSEVVS